MAQPSTRANCPRSVFLKRLSLPFFISRKMALERVASGVGAAVFHSPCSVTLLTISLQRIGSPFAFNTCAAASKSDSFFGFGSFLAAASP